MNRKGRLAPWLVISVIAAASPALGAAAFKKDPDWPCQQPKVSEFPLASVWDGPAVDLDPPGWRDDPQVATLAAQMSQRRVPVADVKAAVDKLQATDGSAAKPKIKQAFGAAFSELTRQRAQILEGLDRYGHKQREMADRIRAENDAAHEEPQPGVAPSDAKLQKLEWDLRIYDERQLTIRYVCEAPQTIEARIGALVKIVRPLF